MYKLVKKNYLCIIICLICLVYIIITQKEIRKIDEGSNAKNVEVDNLEKENEKLKIELYKTKKDNEVLNTKLNDTVSSLRSDIQKYSYDKGMYFIGANEGGLCLGIALLIDDNGKIARIIMGYPTAG